MAVAQGLEGSCSNTGQHAFTFESAGTKAGYVNGDIAQNVPQNKIHLRIQLGRVIVQKLSTNHNY